ncbi:hypothetical protein PVAG01_04750 [Phlyctema vagabunda]|uniref:Uncharacterized protein n=1 Tax=Phlyctema vagabunda TaxID=108571 RepID=A0ABR4PI54_9HELO
MAIATLPLSASATWFGNDDDSSNCKGLNLGFGLHKRTWDKGGSDECASAPSDYSPPTPEYVDSTSTATKDIPDTFIIPLVPITIAPCEKCQGSKTAIVPTTTPSCDTCSVPESATSAGTPIQTSIENTPVVMTPAATSESTPMQSSPEAPSTTPSEPFSASTSEVTSAVATTGITSIAVTPFPATSTLSTSRKTSTATPSSTLTVPTSSFTGAAGQIHGSWRVGAGLGVIGVAAVML